MVFSSISFLYYFLPITLIVYFIVPKKGRNLVLLLASLLFYFWGEPKYSLLMLGSALSGYIHGLLIEKAKGTKYAKIPLISSLVVSLGLLIFFKYTDFFITNFNGLFGADAALLKVILPIGISFYTFQVLSYTIDVYRGEAKVQKSFISFATYVSLFPQLIAGPIVRYSTVQDELDSRTTSMSDFSAGVVRFIQGLGKKVLIADTLSGLVTICQDGEKTVVLYWMLAISFTLQIYFDFSGYSDMAIGLGRMLGFHFLENFDYPYVSKSITEFWRGWHMSLGTWFRDYVYIPLGGNRVPKWRWFLNIFIVWFLTGFWHGAEWNFILWGLYFGVILVLEKLFLLKWLDKLPKFFRHIYAMILVIFGFVIFNANSAGEAFRNISGIFGGQGVPFVNDYALYYLRSYAVLLVVAVVLATPLLKNIISKLSAKTVGNSVVSVLKPVAVVFVIGFVTAYLVDGSLSPFLYFRF